MIEGVGYFRGDRLTAIFLASLAMDFFIYEFHLSNRMNLTCSKRLKAWSLLLLLLLMNTIFLNKFTVSFERDLKQCYRTF